MRVLLVDDEKKFVTVLAQRLSLRGIGADYAFNSDEALGKVRKTKYDIAVLDVKIPGQSGIELRRDLQARDPEMKFIFVTGHGSDADYRVGSAEAAFFLPKPLKIEDLIDAIHRALS